MAKSSTDCKVPCAFDHYTSQTRKKMNTLAPLEGQLAFQHWVAYIRSNVQDLSPKLRFKCPIFLCNASHEDLESLLKHVASCPSLNDARYWCPCCNRVEQFPVYCTSQAAGQTKALQKTRSKLKAAVQFFRQLSLRSRGHKDIAELAGPSTHKYKNSWLPPELDIKDPLRADLAGISTHKYKNSWLPPELDVKDPLRVELIGEWPSNRTADPYTQQVASERRLHELTARRTFVRSLHELATEVGESKPKKAHSSAGGTNCASKGVIGAFCSASTPDSGYNSPVDSIQPSISTTSGRPSSIATTPRSFSPFLSPVPLMLPAENTRAYMAEDKSPVEEIFEAPIHTSWIPELSDDRCSHLGTASSTPQVVQSPQIGSCAAKAIETLSTQIQVEELRHVFKILRDQWMLRLESFHDLQSKVVGLSDDKAFERSLETLRRVILGELPQTFDAVFELMLVAIACAYVLHEGHDMPYWNTLLQDIMRWRHAVADLDERRLYVRVLVHVMTPPLRVSKGLDALDFPSNIYQRPSVMDQKDPPRDPLFNANASSEQPLATKPSMTVEMNIDLPLEELLKGSAMSACLEVLAGVALSELSERFESYQMTASWYTQQHVTNIEDMRRSIIWKLRQCPEMKVIQDEIVETERSIINGMLRSPREVEVTLLYHCKNSCKKRCVYEKCCRIISKACDKPMLGEGSKWRTRHHALDLDTVLAFSKKSKDMYHLLPSPVDGKAASGRLEPGSLQYPMDINPSSPSSEQSLANLLRSPFMPTQLHDHTGTMQNFTTTVKAAAKATVCDTMPTPPPSETSTSSSCETILCEQCQQKITIPNLSRHIRTRHRPREEDIHCHYLECKTTISGNRPDNLDKHLRNFHGETPLKRYGVKKRKRSASESTADGGPSPTRTAFPSIKETPDPDFLHELPVQMPAEF